MASTSPYLTKKEAAAHLRMSMRWLEEQLQTNFPPPALKTGKQYMFKCAELELWFEQKFRQGDAGVLLRDSFGGGYE
jgi:uncharacterized protein (UPF0216 family)